MKTLVKYGSSVIVLSLLPVACSPPPRTEETTEEKAGTTAQALGEAECATNTLLYLKRSETAPPGAAGAIILNPLFTSTTTSNPNTISSSYSYGSAGCENQFVVQVGLNFGSGGLPAGWLGAEPLEPLDEAACKYAVFSLSAYGHDVYGWHLDQAKLLGGSWYGNVCGFDRNLKPGTPVYDSNSSIYLEPNRYDVVRVAASLRTIQYIKGEPYNVYLPVSAGIVP